MEGDVSGLVTRISRYLFTFFFYYSRLLNSSRRRRRYYYFRCKVNP